MGADRGNETVPCAVCARPLGVDEDQSFGVWAITDQDDALVEMWATEFQARDSITRCAEWLNGSYEVTQWSVQGLGDVR